MISLRCNSFVNLQELLDEPQCCRPHDKTRHEPHYGLPIPPSSNYHRYDNILKFLDKPLEWCCKCRRLKAPRKEIRPGLIQYHSSFLLENVFPLTSSKARKELCDIPVPTQQQPSELRKPGSISIQVRDANQCLRSPVLEEQGWTKNQN